MAPYLKRVVYCTGFYTLLSPMYRVYQSGKIHDWNFEKPFNKEEVTKNLEQYSSKNGESWAIITGASEGIGRQYAIDLAQTGLFNLLLVSRSIDKLNKVNQQIDSD